MAHRAHYRKPVVLRLASIEQARLEELRLLAQECDKREEDELMRHQQLIRTDSMMGLPVGYVDAVEHA